MGHRLAGLILLLALPAGRIAFAGLGDPASSAATDAAALQGTLTTTPLQRYDLQRIAAPGGLVIREYSTAATGVFAVAWNGPLAPNLAVLLGSRFAEYQNAFAALRTPGLHRSLSIDRPDLVVSLDGRPRAYSGRAYLPSGIPAGVTVAELR